MGPILNAQESRAPPTQNYVLQLSTGENSLGERKTLKQVCIFFQEQFYYLVFVIILRVSKSLLQHPALKQFTLLLTLVLQGTFWYSKAKYQKIII